MLYAVCKSCFDYSVTVTCHYTCLRCTGFVSSINSSCGISCVHGHIFCLNILYIYITLQSHKLCLTVHEYVCVLISCMSGWLIYCRSHWYWRQTSGWSSWNHQCTDQCWDSGMGADRWQARDCHQCSILGQTLLPTDGVAETISPIKRCSWEHNNVLSGWYRERIPSRHWVRESIRILLLQNICCTEVKNL